MKETYVVGQRFHKKSLALIETVNGVVNEYLADGYRLTIRQLYYQLVARGVIENTTKSYDNVVNLMTNARLGGLVDWDAIEDRTRGFLERAHWGSGGELLEACARQYHEDLWQDQDYRLFVVVEKEALAGVLERTCNKLDIPLLPARGYPSATTLREFAKQRIITASQRVVILHLGDHDPSGIDMSRDLEDRLQMFSRNRVGFEFKRIALNMEQVEEQSPPPNPAKVTDSRFNAYQERFGDESWELDALSPQYIDTLVTTHAMQYVDAAALQYRKDNIASVRERLAKIAQDFDEGQA